jgi:hypothetical protein
VLASPTLLEAKKKKMMKAEGKVYVVFRSRRESFEQPRDRLLVAAQSCGCTTGSVVVGACVVCVSGAMNKSQADWGG